MAEKKPAKMSDADLKFFEEMLIEKRRQLVVADAKGDIVWLVGLRIDDRFRVTDATSSVLRIEKK